MNVVVLVAAHKPCQVMQSEVYKPVLAGSALRPEFIQTGWLRDDALDNISDKNPYYCELTALYWGWKNIEADYLGLVHYRRYFCGSHYARDKWKRIMRLDELESLLAQFDVILPRQRHYVIETSYSQFAHAHGGYALDAVKEIIEERFPEYRASYDRIMGMTSGHRFNMLIMKRELLNAYCEWIFDLLAELEKRLAESGRLTPRLIGHISERLLDVWLLKNQTKYTDIPTVFTEKQNWIIKGAGFLVRKMKNGKGGEVYAWQKRLRQ